MVMKNFIKAIKWVDPYKLKKTWIIKIFVVAFSLDIFAFSCDWKWSSEKYHTYE